jgi:hypothetical protein
MAHARWHKNTFVRVKRVNFITALQMLNPKDQTKQRYSDRPAADFLSACA